MAEFIEKQGVNGIPRQSMADKILKRKGRGNIFLHRRARIDDLLDLQDYCGESGRFQAMQGNRPNPPGK